MPSFLDRLADGHVLLTDGATGTNFQQMGLPPGVAPDDWVFDAPERVRELHAGFARAGSEFALACSFGANSAPAGRRAACRQGQGAEHSRRRAGQGGRGR